MERRWDKNSNPGFITPQRYELGVNDIKSLTLSFCLWNKPNDRTVEDAFGFKKRVLVWGRRVQSLPICVHVLWMGGCYPSEALKHWKETTGLAPANLTSLPDRCRGEACIKGS